MKTSYLFAAALIAAVHAPASAQLNVGIAKPWVRATVPAQKVSGGYVTLTASGDARLIEVQSTAAGRVEMHKLEMEGQVMKMRQIDGIDLPAGKAVELKPGGLHLMLMELKQPLKAGDKVPVIFYIEGKDKSRTNVTVNMVVKPLGATE
ncbi:MAG TPA: copper chaperone PCu(A)C [Burkholderiaceae bacterium]